MASIGDGSDEDVWECGGPERCYFGENVLIVELQCQSWHLRSLAVEVILTLSKLQIGERNWDSGTVEVVLMVNARPCMGVGTEDIGKVRYLFVPVIDSINGAMVSTGLFLFMCARSSTLHG